MKVSMIIKISLLVAVIVLVSLYMLRLKRLFANSAVLSATSNTFSRDYYVGSPGNTALTYLALGDSITQGTGTQRIEDGYVYQVAKALADKNHYVHVLNLAVSGAKTEDVIKKQLPKIGDLQADYITMTIGTNDATHFVNLKEYEANWREILASLEGQPKATIMVANAVDTSTLPSLPPIYAQAVGQRAMRQNEIVERVLKQSKLKIIDLYGEGKLRSGVNPAYYASDLFHPAEAGYAKWSKLFLDQL